MLEKHLKRIKKAETGNPEEDEWVEIPTLGQRIPDQIVEEVPDRSIRIEKIKKSNYEEFERDSPKLKDQFTNTAQYFDLAKKLVEEKKIHFDNFKKGKERFDKEISILNPKKTELKFDLNKFDYKEVKIAKLKHEITKLQTEREEIKNKITHFKNQIEQSQSELSFKVDQIEDIKLELQRLEKKEALQNKIKTEQEAIDIIKNELRSIGDVGESKKIFRTVNTLVELLNEKNKVTVNELKSVKEEFNELQIKYNELMSKLK
jgi:chromosome segregation ATPase